MIASCIAIALAASAHAAQQPDGSSAIEIPFAIDQSRIVLDVEIAPGHVLPFVFDSGLSEGNIVSTVVATSLHIKGIEKARIGDATGDRQMVEVATLPTIRMGNLAMNQQIFAIIDLPDAVTRRASGTPVAGFIGAPLMDAAVLCLDYRQRTLKRWPRESFKSAGRVSVPMKLVHALPTIAVLIDGRPATMIVDSGNNAALVLYAAFADSKDFRARYPRLAVQGGRDGGGQPYQALAGDARSVEIAPGAGFENVPFAVIPQGMDPAWGIDGMVGFEVLSQLNPCLDRDGGKFFFYGE